MSAEDKAKGDLSCSHRDHRACRPVPAQALNQLIGSVRRYQILDTPPDGAFDRVASVTIEVSDDDRTVATAEVTTSEASGGTARVSLRAEPGHITPGRRANLVDAVLDLPQVQQSARVEAAFRLGDSESLHRLRERCQDVSLRPAGWSALLDANLPSSRDGAPIPGDRPW